MEKHTSGLCRQEQEMKEKQDSLDALHVRTLGESMTDKVLPDLFYVKVSTSKKESKILNFEDNILKVELKAKPIEGEANKELLKLLKKTCGTEYIIDSGYKSRLKKIVKKN